MEIKDYIFSPEKSLIKDFNSASTNGFTDKHKAFDYLERRVKELSKLQDVLFAHKKYSIIILLQGMDASGKDSLIKNVMSGVNPQGVSVHSFGTPTQEEFAHDFLWRCNRFLPERGNIGVFNRSYYEEVLIVRIHPEFLVKQNLPNMPTTEDEYEQFWDTRYTDINNYEKYLLNNGIIVLKFFLNISKEEQKKRFLRRIEKSAKNWKFRPDDLSERASWDKYISAYEQMMIKTSTEDVPWHVIPADNKWAARPVVCDIVINAIEKLSVSYPKVTYAEKRAIIKSKFQLLNEDIVPLSSNNPALK